MTQDTETVSDAVQRLWREIGGEDVPTLDCCENAEPAKRTRKRRPTLVGVARQAARAGIPVAGYEFRPDGTIGVVVGKPVQMNADDDRNEWDTVQ